MTTESALTTTLPVKLLDARHPDYAANAACWDNIDLLYRGGHTLKNQAARFLVKRPKELPEVYEARAGRFTYQNILGTALGWYQAAMFTDDPDILIRRGEAEIDGDRGDFYARFLEDCNRAGRTFTDLFRDVFLHLMLYRSTLILTDLPKMERQPATLAEQKAAGALDPYLVLYEPRQVINWETDAYGNLAWVVIATTAERRQFAQDAAVVDRWYYFDRSEYRVYESQRKKDSREKSETASLVDSGPHALAEAGRVPARWVQIPDALWLANRAYLQVIDHLNQDNSYAWALFMANLPVPVIKGDYEQPPTVSETAFIQLPENGAFEWAEPSGSSFQHSAARIASLREEIYRQLYLQAQGRSTEATPAAQSGYSKEMDMAPSRDVLNGFGDVLRAAMLSVLIDVAAIRGEADLAFDVRGFTFDDDDAADELATAEAAIGLNIPSDTLEKEIQKRVARVLLKDARPDVIQKVEGEIDAAPGKEERARQAMEQQRSAVRASLQGAVAKLTGGKDSLR